MTEDEERDYHTARARDELDWSYRAAHKAAAEAHMRLSAMHMKLASTPRPSDD